MTSLTQGAVKARGLLEDQISTLLGGDPGGQRQGDGRVVQAILANFEQNTSLDAGWRSAANGVLQRTGNYWNDLTKEAIELSIAAAPGAFVDDLTALTHHEPGEADLRSADQEGVQHGAVWAGSSAIALGILAAASATITWPVILAAVPVGFAAAYHRRRTVLDGRLADLDGAAARLSALAACQRDNLSEQMRAELPVQIETTLEGEVEQMLMRTEKELFGSIGLDMTMRHIGSIQSIVGLLDELEKYCVEKSGAASARGMLDSPIVVAAGQAGIGTLDLLCGRIMSRLDLSLAALEGTLEKLLVHLRPDVHVRLIFMTREADLERDRRRVETAFGDWSGVRQVRALFLPPEFVRDAPTDLLITDDRALISQHRLTSLGQMRVQLEDHPRGRLAAEAHFAELWTGSVPGCGQARIRAI